MIIMIVIVIRIRIIPYKPPEVTLWMMKGGVEINEMNTEM